MQNYDIKSISKLDINYPDIYFTPEYGRLCELSDKGKWNCVIDKKGELLIPFIEKKIKVGQDNIKHLVSNYGYGGFYISSKYRIDYTKLEEIMQANNSVTHFIRFTPYFNNNTNGLLDFFNNSKITLKGLTYGINFNSSNYIDYLKNTRKNHRRSLKKYQDKCRFLLRDISSNDILEHSNFRQIYRETMDRVGSSKYYYFSNEYFQEMFNLLKNNIFIAEIIFVDTDEVISSAIIFKWKNEFLHYHLGGSKTDYLKYAPNNKLHDGIIKYGFNNNYKLYHLGGGVTRNDALDKYKKSFANCEFEYYQGKIIYNKEQFDYISNEYESLNHKSNKDIFPCYINTSL